MFKSFSLRGASQAKKILCLMVSLLVHSSGQAAETNLRNHPWGQSLIEDNLVISEWFDGMAEGLDLFLAGKKMTDRRNETQLIVESGFYYSDLNGYSDATSFNINLRLPNVEEYWQVTFTSYDENKERGVSNSYLRQSPRQRDYGATIGFFRKLGDVKTAFQPRISFSGTPKISHALIFESLAERKGYKLNPRLEFYASADKGPGIFQSLNFNFKLSKSFSLTWVNEGDYEDRTHLYTLTNGLVFTQTFNDVSSINYNFFVTSVNTPNQQLDNYIFSIMWNHQLYKNILDYQIGPNLRFDTDTSFTGNPGVVLNLILLF